MSSWVIKMKMIAFLPWQWRLCSTLMARMLSVHDASVLQQWRLCSTLMARWRWLPFFHDHDASVRCIPSGWWKLQQRAEAELKGIANQWKITQDRIAIHCHGDLHRWPVPLMLIRSRRKRRQPPTRSQKDRVKNWFSAHCTQSVRMWNKQEQTDTSYNRSLNKLKQEEVAMRCHVGSPVTT